MRFWTFCVQGHMNRHQAFNEDRRIVTALPFHRHPYWAVFEDQLDETECLSPSSQSPIASNYRRKSLTSHWSASLQSTQDHSKSIPIVADGVGVFVRVRACVCVHALCVRVNMCGCRCVCARLAHTLQRDVENRAWERIVRNTEQLDENAQERSEKDWQRENNRKTLSTNS